jgi:hypothetical protein
MPDSYFSERELGARPRIVEEIGLSVWGGLVATLNSRFNDGSFGYRYPAECPDGNNNVCGCDLHSLSLSLTAENPDISLPLDARNMPPTLAILDLLEFCHRAVGKPVQTNYHPYFNHHHLRFEAEVGQAAFREDIDRIFSRNGIAYELRSDGNIIRLAPEGLRETLTSTVFRTGDDELNLLLNIARAKYLDPNPTVRQESLEKLWDAWERLKTIEPGADKIAKVTALLNRASPETTFRDALNKEAIELTRIGNNFRIRHSETTQIPLQLTEHVDYLFHRLFALIMLFLKTTNRCV